MSSIRLVARALFNSPECQTIASKTASRRPRNQFSIIKRHEPGFGPNPAVMGGNQFQLILFATLPFPAIEGWTRKNPPEMMFHTFEGSAVRTDSKSPVQSRFPQGAIHPVVAAACFIEFPSILHD